MHGCGNVEFEINFMNPRLTIYDSKQIATLTITDTMNPNDPMEV